MTNSTTQLWAARDRDGQLFLYTKEPRRDKFGNFHVAEVNGTFMMLQRHDLTYVTTHNSPVRVYLRPY